MTEDNADSKFNHVNDMKPPTSVRMVFIRDVQTQLMTERAPDQNIHKGEGLS